MIGIVETCGDNDATWMRVASMTPTLECARYTFTTISTFPPLCYLLLLRLFVSTSATRSHSDTLCLVNKGGNNADFSRFLRLTLRNTKGASGTAQDDDDEMNVGGSRRCMHTTTAPAAFTTPFVYLGAQHAWGSTNRCMAVGGAKAGNVTRLRLAMNAQQDGSRWAAGLRRAVHVSAVSLSVLVCALRGGSGANAGASGGQVHVPREAASDVEAAAITLGAVTVGGLVMRAVLASRRDEDKEREKLAAECARLEEEEMERSRRLRRKAMEKVEGSEELPEDDALQSSLQRRLQDIGEDDGEDDGEDAEKKFMRNSPIPDRGTGSMLLDRPDAGDQATTRKGTSADDGEEEEEEEEEEEGASAEELEMLKRMWNLNSPDNEQRTS